ncbi:hypothetical protein Tco_0333662 [Tanacetum coccineum]
MEDLTAAVMLMAQIQPANGNAETVPSYDAKAVSEVNASSKVHEQKIRVAHKFDRLADKQSGRPSGSLPSNTQPNP